MKVASSGFVAATTATIREPKAKVEFVWTDPFVDPLLTVTTDDKNYNIQTATGDILKQVVNTLTEPTHEYCILDGTWLLDGTKYLSPYSPKEVSENQIGWYSESVCDADGDFEVPYPYVNVNFGSPRSITNLRVVGDSLLNQYPVDFYVTIYDDEDQVLYLEAVVDNTLVEWTKDIAFAGITEAVKMKLEISKWSFGSTVAKILEFYSVEADTFSGDEIVSLGILEERSAKNGSSPLGNISMNEIDLKLQNIEIVSGGVTYKDPFSFGNSEGNRFYNFLKPNRRIIAYLGFKFGATIEYIKMGTFWTIGDWRANEMDFSATVTAQDRMKFLKDNTFKCKEIDSTLLNISLYDLAQYVLTDAKENIPLQDLRWDISMDLQSITIPVGWFGKVSYFDAIKAIAECCIGHAWMNRDDELKIYPDKLTGTTDLTITRDDYFNKSQPSNVGEMKNYVEVTLQTIYKQDTDDEGESIEKPIVHEGKQYNVPANSTLDIEIEYSSSPVSESESSIVNITAGSPVITATKYYTYGCTITVQNTSKTEAATFEIEVKAWQWDVSYSNEIIIEKTDSLIQEYGKKEYKFENHLVQSYGVGKLIAETLIDNYSLLRSDVDLNWRGDPRLEVSDVIDVPEYKTSTAQFVVQKNNWQYDGGLRCDTEARKVIV